MQIGSISCCSTDFVCPRPPSCALCMCGMCSYIFTGDARSVKEIIQATIAIVRLESLPSEMLSEVGSPQNRRDPVLLMGL